MASAFSSSTVATFFRINATSVVLVGAIFLAYKIWDKYLRRNSLAHIPFHKFEDGDDSQERYIRDSEALLQSGYTKYSKRGRPFFVRNPADKTKPQLIMPFKYLDEVKNAPQNRLSFPLFSQQAFLLNYNNAPQQTDAAAHIVRSDLNKNLAILVEIMQSECELALPSKLPPCEDWTPLQPYMILAYTIARIATRVLSGEELARNDEWINMAIMTTIMVMKAAEEIREKYPPFLRFLAPYMLPGPKAALANRKRAAEVLRPVWEKRYGIGAVESKQNDGIEWLMAAGGGKKAQKTAQEIADEQLFLGVTSIHSSTAYLLSIVYDLAERPDCVEDIRNEIEAVQAECGTTWTKQSLAKLEKLDSFMKESQRLHPIGLVTVQRSTPTPYTFSDGLSLPRHTQLSFPMHPLNHDPTIYPHPHTFDPYRFLNLRHSGDEATRNANKNKYHFAFVSDESINFGAGTHACPGRFFASHELKLVLTYLLLRYEMRFPEGKGRPANVAHDFNTPPDVTAEVLLKKRCQWEVRREGA